MKDERRNIKVVLSGGGTGGHIFPALAIAERIKKELPSAQFLFIGAKGKMEMQKVPAAGYEIVGLPIAGFQRGKILKNVLLPLKLIFSLLKAFFVLLRFKPDCVIGTGGYASAPTMKVASWMNIPVYIQEQNSYPGITNKIMKNSARRIFVAYPRLDRFFPSEKIVLTGNPIRNIFYDLDKEKIRISLREKYGLKKNQPLIFITGGSQGARNINQAIFKDLKQLYNDDIAIIWQTGQSYYQDLGVEVEKLRLNKIFVEPFINNMHEVYCASDLVIARAGALTISELMALGCACVFVPLPHAAENHQFKNAESLRKEDAAMIVLDKKASETLVPEVLKLIKDKERLLKFQKNISKFARQDSDGIIVRNILSDLKFK
ncbi:MAG: undecaprenyldiphospho-muramoylpentapeptide beta-N-acetylglucosaminyltransferase [Bacteroidales bacterium]